MNKIPLLFLLVIQSVFAYDFDKVFGGKKQSPSNVNITTEDFIDNAEDAQQDIVNMKEREQIARESSRRSSSTNMDFIDVSVDCGFACATDRLTVQGSNANNLGSSSSTIMKRYDGTRAGTYSFVAERDSKSCVGSFSVNESSQFVYIYVDSFYNCDYWVDVH